MRYVSYNDNGKKCFGWVRKRDLLDLTKDFIWIRCEDRYGGARAVVEEKENIWIEPIQKQGPLGRAYYGSYFDEKDKIIGIYSYNPLRGLSVKKL